MTKTFHRANIPHRDTKTGHRGDQKPIASKPKIITIASDELQRIKNASIAEGDKAGFDRGVQYIVSEVETILCKELGFKSREELVKSGRMPAVWIAALIAAYHEDYEERIRKKAEETKGR